MKVKLTVNDIRMRTSLTIRTPKDLVEIVVDTSFFHTFLGFRGVPKGPLASLSNPAGTYFLEKHIKTTGVE